MEAEQALLGLLITHNDKIEEVIDTLRPFHFYHKTHQKIYQTIMHLADLNKEFSPITLPQYMNESDLAEAGGVNYFIDLHECFVSSGGAPDYAEIIVDYFLRRKIESISDDSLAHIYSMDISHRGKDCLEAMEKKIFDLSEASTHCQAFFLTTSLLGSLTTWQILLKTTIQTKAFQRAFWILINCLADFIQPT